MAKIRYRAIATINTQSRTADMVDSLWSALLAQESVAPAVRLTGATFPAHRIGGEGVTVLPQGVKTLVAATGVSVNFS